MRLLLLQRRGVSQGTVQVHVHGVETLTRKPASFRRPPKLGYATADLD
jgi:hypothetical protein